MSERLRDQTQTEIKWATGYDRALIPATEVLDIIKRIRDAGEADYDHGFRAGSAYASNESETTLLAIERALNRDINTYGERCDIALALIQRSITQLRAASQGASPSDAAFLLACNRWPEETAEHRAMRAAFCDGAAPSSHISRRP